MRKQFAAAASVLAAALTLAVGGGDRAAAQEKDKAAAPEKEKKASPPRFLYGHDLRVRPGGKPDFEKDTPRIGVEFFQDDSTGSFIAISETGALSVAPAGPVGMEVRMKWLTAHELSVRKAGEPDFTQRTKKYGIELFEDRASNHLLYVCETGSIALAPVPGGLVTTAGPSWHHAGEYRVRNADQTNFETAKKLGIEVSKDGNTGGLIYITETGAIATAPAPATQPDSKKLAPPKAVYGMVLRVRGADEPNFTPETRKMGVEVFEDLNNNNILVYITEAGYIATAPKVEKFAEAGVTWKSAMALKARKGSEKEFEKARKFGIEVFVDNRTGNLLFVSETGSIAVLPKR